MSHPGCFTPGKVTQYPLYRRLSGPQVCLGWVWKIAPPQGFDLRTVQLIASCYTDLPPCTHFYETHKYSEVLCSDPLCQILPKTSKMCGNYTHKCIYACK
jgi:hypothetical protein